MAYGEAAAAEELLPRFIGRPRGGEGGEFLPELGPKLCKTFLMAMVPRSGNGLNY